jgi:transcriptional regulator GlxA family with amidase domain
MKPKQLFSSARRGGISLPSPSGDRASLAGRRADPEDTAARKVERCIAYMQEHVNRPLQVATLAAQANISPSHFFALFKELTGCPPMDYFTRLRMRHASRLLGSTPASVKEVAAALGYDDPFYFSRVFKSVHRVPPSRYRALPSRLADAPEEGWLSPVLTRGGFPARPGLKLND